jgi:hypothetical protein
MKELALISSLGYEVRIDQLILGKRYSGGRSYQNVVGGGGSSFEITDLKMLCWRSWEECKSQRS